jgi:predicted RNA methylase
MSTDISYLHKYFPYLNKNKRSQLKYDEIGLYSISPPKNADIITSYILQYYKKTNIVVTDAMSGLGGNVLSFASSLYYVNAIEYDEIRYSHMVSNISLFSKDNVLCINADYLQIMHQLKQDIIFMDPPWGGKSYKDTNLLSIDINGIPFQQICDDIYDTKLCSMLILKLPLNYNINDFSDKIKDKLIIERLPKILIVILLID